MSRLARIDHGNWHEYRLEGQKLDGVTTAISDGYPIRLVQWGADMAADYAIDHWSELTDAPTSERYKRIRYAHANRLREAALRGTDLHTYGEQVVHGEPVEIPEEYRGPVSAYAKFLDDWQIEPIATETPLANLEYGYAGTADLWATIGAHDGERALIDMKTGKGVYDSVALQLAAYRNATLWQHDDAEDENVPSVDACYVAHVTADAVELVPVTADAREFRIFLYVLQVARWKREHGSWKPKGVPVLGAAETFKASTEVAS